MAIVEDDEKNILLDGTDDGTDHDNGGVGAAMSGYDGGVAIGDGGVDDVVLDVDGDEDVNRGRGKMDMWWLSKQFTVITQMWLHPETLLGSKLNPICKIRVRHQFVRSCKEQELACKCL